MIRRIVLLLAAGLMLIDGAPAAALSLEQLNGQLPGTRAEPPGVTSWELLGKASVLFEEKGEEFTVTTVIPPEVEALDGRQLKLMGFMVPVEAELQMRKFLLVQYPADCPFCVYGSAEPSRMVEVESAQGIDFTSRQVVLDGRLEVVRGDENGLLYRLREAVAVAATD